MLLIALILLAGCAQISEEKAQAIARVFISKQVKLFIKTNETLNTNITDEKISMVSLQKTPQGYSLAFNMSGNVNGLEKTAIVKIGVSNEGKVITLNGQNIRQR